MSDNDDEIDYAEDETTEKTIEIAEETMTGDMRDRILDLIKTMLDVWEKMSEMDQRSYAQSVEMMTEYLVQDAVKIIASNDRACITANLEQYTEKDGLKIILKAHGKRETVAALHEACGQQVLIVVASPDMFYGERDQADVDEDEPSLFDQTNIGETIADEAPEIAAE